jgi:hypothetical protein
MVYNFNKHVAGDRLTSEIQSSAIAIALDYITGTDTTTSIYFKGELSTDEQVILSGIVDVHVATNLPGNQVLKAEIITMPERDPFAKPTHRTKRSATNAIISIEPNEVENIDLLMIEERFTFGGLMIVTGAQLGDYITAEVVDTLALIPAPYRAAMAENWPTVARYIDKAWVNPHSGVVEINTQPLTAKIPPGFTLRVTYHASSEGSTRKAGVNYYLTKLLLT